MTCAWCGRRFWPWQKVFRAAFPGAMHRGCWHKRWDEFFAAGPGGLRYFTERERYEILLTVPTEYMPTVQTYIDEQRVLDRAARSAPR